MRRAVVATLVVLASSLMAAVAAPSWAQQQPAVQPDIRGTAATVTLHELQQAARSGAAEAQYQLALQLQRGELLLQDYDRAALWLRRAADQDHVAAQTRLGQSYLQGLGVAQDAEQALQWLERAARSGAPAPLFQLASLLEQGPAAIADPARAAQLYQQAAELGHVDAAVSLGVLYQNGTGVAQDLARARTLYEAPAQAGHARALNNLGLIHVRGEGGPQDYALAAQLFQAAAERGLAVALNNLGTLYENGFGVPLDEARAAALYRQAADLGRGGSALISTTRPGAIYPAGLGFPDVSAAGLAALRGRAQAGEALAQFQLGWLMLQPETTSAPQAPSQPASEAAPGQAFHRHQQAAALMQAAAQGGQPEAMINLALLYYEGRVLPQDYMLAYMWLVLAMAIGQPEAQTQTLTQTQAHALATSLGAQLPAGQILQAQQRAQKIAPEIVEGIAQVGTR